MKSKRMKPVKAWAIVNEHGLCEAHPRRKTAQERSFSSDRIIRVLITEIPRKPRKVKR